jgi:hypothetical protein
MLSISVEAVSFLRFQMTICSTENHWACGLRPSSVNLISWKAQAFGKMDVCPSVGDEIDTFFLCSSLESANFNLWTNKLDD